MMKYAFMIIGLFFSGLLTAQVEDQPGWNWPSDPDEKKEALEKQAFYKIQIQLDKYDVALNALNYLYRKAPDLNESIYIDGARIMEDLLKVSKNETRNDVLRDSLLWTYDMRVKYFDNDAAAIDRKAYTAFKLYYKTSSKYDLLRKLYQDLYKQNAEDISTFNITPYMTLANYYYKANPEEFTAEDVLDVHQSISIVIDQKVGAGGDKVKLQKEQDKIDAFLSALDGILSCDFIKEKLVPKFNNNPENLNQAKKIFSYSLTAKCTSEPYFSKAAETLFKNEPSFKLAKALGDRAYSSEDYTKALEYYNEGLKLAEEQNDKFDALMGKASTLAKQGQKSQSRAIAREALSVQPGANEAYNLIGNLYFTSFETCRGGESKVMDRAIFLAAYEMYSKAGNNAQMEASKQQFPSIEEIFTEQYEEGQKVTVECWINESVTLRRR